MKKTKTKKRKRNEGEEQRADGGTKDMKDRVGRAEEGSDRRKGEKGMKDWSEEKRR